MPRINNDVYDTEKRICVVCGDSVSVGIPKGDEHYKRKQAYRKSQYEAYGWTQDWAGGNLCGDCGKERAARMSRRGEYVRYVAVALAVAGVAMLAVWGF